MIDLFGFLRKRFGEEPRVPETGVASPGAVAPAAALEKVVGEEPRVPERHGDLQPVLGGELLQQLDLGLLPVLGGARARGPHVSTLAGSGEIGFADGPGHQAMFDHSTGVAVDAWGNVYVVDRLNHRIRKIGPDGVVSTLAGTGERGFADGPGHQAMFLHPNGVAVDAAGNLYVADDHRIRKIVQ